MQKTDFMNAVSRFEYTVTMMCRENFINVETDFINAEKYILLLWNSNMKKHSNLALNLKNMISLDVLWENNEQFLNSE